MRFIAMHNTNHKLSFDIFAAGNLQNIFMEHNILMIFGIKEKCIILTHTLAIATNILVLLKTGFVLQGHKYKIKLLQYLLQTLSLPLPAALSLS